MVRLAQRQISGQLEVLHAIQNQALAIAGFTGALIAAEVAAGSHLLGRRWWAGIIGLAAVAIACFTVAMPTQLDDGPDPSDFNRQFGGLPEHLALAQLLANLQEDLTDNEAKVTQKSGQLGGAYTYLLLTFVYAPFLFAFNR